MWFFLSLIAILFWSGSDIFSKAGSRSEDKYSHWKMVAAVGLVMGAHAAVTLISGAEFSLYDIIKYLPASFMYILSMILGYVGLRYIMLSVSSPICNSSGAVAAILFFFILKETMTVPQLIGVVLVCSGVLALSIYERKREKELNRLTKQDKKHSTSVIAVLFPILYCIIDALGTFVDGYLLFDYNEGGELISGVIAEEQANIAYELTFLMMAVFSIVYVYIIRKQKIVIKADAPKLAAGVCETAGQLAYIYAIGDNAVTAAPLISSYCVFSLIWARLFLKEKLSVFQYIVIAVAFVGIVILGIE